MFRRIIESGSTAILKSTIPCYTVPALSSLLTGTNPGRHGMLSVTKSDGVPTILTGMKYPKFWNVLDKGGFKSCIVGVRATYPPEKLNGIMISGSVPSDKSDYTYPKRLKEKFKFEDDEHTKMILNLRNKKRSKNFRLKLVELICEQTKRRYDIFKKLNQEENYDFSMYWIEETDIIQHFLWEYKDSLFQFYSRLDNILGDILSTFNDRTLFVVSDHGFEASPSQYFFMNSWLQKEGYLIIKRMIPITLVNFGLTLGFKTIGVLARGGLRRFEKLLSSILLLYSKANNDLLDKEIAIRRINVPGIDKKKSTAYLYTPYGIKINKTKNYETIREEIIQKLPKIENHDGEKIIKNVWKREEIYEGEYSNELPDVVFLTSEKYEIFPLVTKNYFSSNKNNRFFWWDSGAHGNAIDGILLAYGPEVRKKQNLGAVRIEDIFPTILHVMGCTIPDHVNGNILMSIFEKNSEPANRKPCFQKYINFTKDNLELEKDDAIKIRLKLRDLGYI